MQTVTALATGRVCLIIPFPCYDRMVLGPWYTTLPPHLIHCFNPHSLTSFPHVYHFPPPPHPPTSQAHTLLPVWLNENHSTTTEVSPLPPCRHLVCLACARFMHLWTTSAPNSRISSLSSSSRPSLSLWVWSPLQLVVCSPSLEVSFEYNLFLGLIPMLSCWGLGRRICTPKR